MVETRKSHILIVDDDLELIDLLSNRLIPLGFRVSSAHSGPECIALVNTDRPDLIILEAVMPGQSGYEIATILKNDINTKYIPIIFLTRKNDISDKVKALKIGANDYITKPFHPRELVARVSNLLRIVDEYANMPKAEKLLSPRVFISYKWEDGAHSEWVAKFATDLRSAGIVSFLDIWEVRLGDSFAEYMTSKIHQSNALLFIMTNTAVEAVENKDKGTGGAIKFEMQLATARKIAGNDFRIIPIYREGDKTVDYLSGNRYIDFRDNSKYQENMQKLVDDLLGQPIAPPIGKP